MKAEARRWFAKAEEDLEDARYMLQGQRAAPTGFFAQQAVEKALKAILLNSQGAFPKMHDLVALGRLVEMPDGLLAGCALLSPAYMTYRYPDVAAPVTLEEADELVKIALEVVTWARTRL